jgi:hypothetical protein
MAASTADHAATVKVDGLSGRTALRALAGRLDQLRNDDLNQTVALDLSNLRGQNKRVTPQWGAVLTNLLMTQFEDVPLKVELPTDATAQLQLARSGLCFALARHRRLRWDLLPDAGERVLRRWRADWQPAAGQQALFNFESERGDDVPAQVEREFVAFLNPNRAPRSSDRPDQAAVTYPWLRELVHVEPELAVLRERLAKDLSRATSELLDNVRRHAQMPPSGQCSISLFITGNGGLDQSRLYLSVLDTGVGIPHTIRRNYAGAGVVDALSDADMLSAACNGQLPRRERDRGRGLNRIQGLVQRTQGRLFVATGPSETGSLVVEHRADDDKDSRVQAQWVDGLRVTGTVVVVSFVLRNGLLAQKERA